MSARPDLCESAYGAQRGQQTAASRALQLAQPRPLWLRGALHFWRVLRARHSRLISARETEYQPAMLRGPLTHI